MRPAQLFFNVYFQVSLSNHIQRNLHAPVCSIVKNELVAFDSHHTATKIALTADRLPGLQLRITACKALVIGPFVEPTFQPGRRYFQCVGSVDEVFDVENRSEMSAHIGAIVVGHTLRLVNKNANDRLVVRAGDFRMNQFEAIVDCYSFS